MKYALNIISLTVFLIGSCLVNGQLNAAEVQTIKSEQGIVALLMEDHTNPVITISLTFRGGSALDPVGMEGLSSMTANLLDEGAATLDSQSFKKRLKDLSISLNFSVSKDSFDITLKTLTENHKEAFLLLRDTLLEPSFDADAVVQARNELLVNLRYRNEDPASVAKKHLFETIFKGHAYGKSNYGTSQGILNISIVAIKDLITRQFVKDRLLIGVVGDIQAKTLMKLLDDTFGALPQSSVLTQLPHITIPNSGGIQHVERDTPQSTIMFAQQGIQRRSNDFYSAYILNHIIGGTGFGSRLYNEIRKKRGLAYSIYTYLATYDKAEIIIGSVSTKTESTYVVLDLIKKEWKRMATFGPSKEELQDAKTYLIGSYPLNFIESSIIADTLVGIQYEDLGKDYLNKRNEYIQSVSLNDVIGLAQKLLDPNYLTIVIVGGPKSQ